MPPLMEYLTTFGRLFVAHDPPYQTWIQPVGAAAKYLKKFHSISDVELTAHLAGRITIAAPLVGADDYAQAAALDIHAGSTNALWLVLDITQQRHLATLALTSTHATYTGGHVWLLFDEPAPATRLRRLVDELAQSVGVAAEAYPSGRTLRLPLGVHRGSMARGRLLLQDGTVVDLDSGADAIATALTRIDALPRNRVAVLPAEPVSPAERPPVACQGGSATPGVTGTTIDGIAAYNGATDLLTLLVRYGGRIAEQYRNGRALLQCPCGCHRNGDAHASLELQPARQPRYGPFVAVGYAPPCAFVAEQRKVVDAFAVYCYCEQLTPADANRSLRGRLGGPAPAPCPTFPAAGGGVRLAFDTNGGVS